MKWRTLTTILLAATLLLSFDGNINRSVFHSDLAGIYSKAQDNNTEIRKYSSSDDTYADSQWYIENPGYYTKYSYEAVKKLSSNKGIDLNVSKAWDYIKQTGKATHEVIVAVIDTGIDYNHPDLANNMWRNSGEIAGDNIDNDHNGYIDDVYGWDFYNHDASVCDYEQNSSQVKTASPEDNDNHGTHVAGIIAAVANNNIGIAGIASDIDIKIMSLKVNGGKDGSGSMEDAVAAIKYAEKMGATICNISWGALGYTNELKNAIKQSNMLFVAAAGNFSDDNDKKPVYPASFQFDNMISVTAVNAQGELGHKANYGLGTVDVAAPGINIYSTIVGGYGYMSGTSMAAPQVTAIAALLYSSHDYIEASEAKDIILNSVKTLPELKGLIKNAGIPDAYQLLMNSGVSEKVNKFDPVNREDDQKNLNNESSVVNSVVRIIIFGTEDMLPVENSFLTVDLLGKLNATLKVTVHAKGCTLTDRDRCLLYRRI